MDHSSTRILGDWGEQEAARYLERRGLRVVDRQYRQKWGEIDLICRDRDTWVFVEVKTRSASSFMAPIESITPRKQQRIIRAAMTYMKWKRLEGSNLRFDVVLIEASHIEWIPNAFQSTSYYTF